MKKLYFLAFTLLFSLNGVSQVNIMDSLKINYLVLKLDKSIDSTSLPPYCGKKKTEATLKYRVLETLKGRFKDSIIYINHTCIRELYEGKSLEKGMIYGFWVCKPKESTQKRYCSNCLNSNTIYSPTFDIYWKKQKDLKAKGRHKLD